MREPPRILEWLLARLVPESERDVVLGDLREEYGAGPATRWTGPLWYLRMAGSVVAWYAISGLMSARGVRGDLRVSVRRLRRAPRYAVLSVTVVALAVGANIATLGIGYGVFLGPLPFPDGDRLGLLTYDHTGSDTDGFGISWNDLVEVEERARLFERVVGVLDWGTVDLLTDGEARRVSASFVGPGYLEVVGADVAVGRAFDRAENGPESALPVALLARDFWVQEMGSDPRAVGRRLELNGVATVVIGVLGADVADFRQRFGATADVYLPLFAADAVLGSDLSEGTGAGPLNGVVRLGEGATWTDAGRVLTEISEDLVAREGDARAGWSFRLERVDEVFYDPVRPLVLVLVIGAALIFLLVLVNLTSLQMVRASGRRRESSVRAALGASPGRLLRLSLVDGALVSGLGGGLGIVAGAWMAWALGRSGLLALPTFAEVRPSGVSATTAGIFVLVLTAMLGLSGWLSSGARGDRTLRPDALRTTTRTGSRLRSAFVVGEVAFAFALAVGAGLMARSLAELRDTDMGFEVERLLTAKVELRGERYASEDARRTVARDLVAVVGRLPEVEHAFLWSPHGIGEGSWVDLLTREGRWDLHPVERVEAYRHHVFPGALAGAGIELLRGRDFGSADDGGGVSVAIVSESLGRLLWPGDDPVGKVVESRAGDRSRAYRIVGIVEDARHRGRLEGPFAPQLDIYYPYEQSPQAMLSLNARLVEDEVGSGTGDRVREAVAEVVPDLAVYDMTTVSDRLRAEADPLRLTAVLTAGYALVASLLACLGIYGVLAESVRARTKEIGVRMALGAGVRGVAGRIALGGLLPLLPGLLLGAALLAVAERMLSAVVYGVDPWDPWIAASAAVLLSAVALAAASIPAYRAASVDPTVALRGE